jgi:hypothetical protein
MKKYTVFCGGSEFYVIAHEVSFGTGFLEFCHVDEEINKDTVAVFNHWDFWCVSADQPKHDVEPGVYRKTSETLEAL